MEYIDWALARFYEQERLTEAMYEAGFDDMSDYLEFLAERYTNYE